METNGFQFSEIKETKKNNWFLIIILILLFSILSSSITYYFLTQVEECIDEKIDLETREESSNPYLVLLNESNLIKETIEDISACEGYMKPGLIIYKNIEKGGQVMILAKRNIAEKNNFLDSYLQAETFINNSELLDNDSGRLDPFIFFCSMENYKHLGNFKDINISNVKNYKAGIYHYASASGVPFSLSDISFALVIYVSAEEEIGRVSYSFEGDEIFDLKEVEHCYIQNMSSNILNIDCVNEVYLSSENAQNKVRNKLNDLINTFKFH